MSDSTTQQRVMNMVVRGRLTASADGAGMQFADLSLLRDEAKANVERFQQYGFSSVPEAGSEVVAICVGGTRDHMIVLAADNRASRIRGQAEGEVAIYSNEGDYIVLKRGNTIEIGTDRLLVSAEVELVIEAPKIIVRSPEIAVEGDIALTGNLTATGAIYAPQGNVGGGARSTPARYEVRGALDGAADPSYVIGWATSRADANALLTAARATSIWPGVLIIDRDAPA